MVSEGDEEDHNSCAHESLSTRGCSTTNAQTGMLWLVTSELLSHYIKYMNVMGIKNSTHHSKYRVPEHHHPT